MVSGCSERGIAAPQNTWDELDARIMPSLRFNSNAPFIQHYSMMQQASSLSKVKAPEAVLVELQVVVSRG